MSFLTGKPPISQQPQELNSINVDSSRYGDPVPLLYGTDRLPALLGWYGAFDATAQTQSGSGKGGGSKNITGYNYTASCVMLLCEGSSGAANTVGQIWKDKAITTLTAEGLVFFSGQAGQSAWSYLTTNFAAQAIPYALTTYVGGQNIDLGSSAALPNYTYEVHGILALPGIAITLTGGLSAGATSATLTGPSTGLVANGVWDITFSDNETRSVTVTGAALVWDAAFPLTLAVTASATIGGGDADPSAIWLDFCQDTNHGANFFLTDPGIQGAGNTWQTYCKANSMLLSVLEDTQRSASSALKDILEITNSDCVMSANVLKIIPYCDAVVSANGVTFTPNLTPLFNFNDDDYLPASEGSSSSSSSDDPVQCIRKPLTQTFNCVRVEYSNRADNYNPGIAEWKDPVDIRVNGLRVMPTKTFHQIKIGSLAQQVATLIGQRQLYIRRTFQFSIRADLYTGLEPMDLISLTDTLVVGGLETRLGLVSQLCRIVQTDDDENDVFTITCEEMLVGTASAPRYNISGAQGFFANYAAVPPNIATPVVFLAPAALVGADGGFELWCAIGEGSAGGSYGGCNLYGSLDDVTWTFLGTVTGQARLGGVSTSHPISASTTGAADTFFLTMNAATDAAGYQLDSASASDFASNRSLIWVDGEVVAFQTVTLLGTAQYSVTVTRGLFGTTAAAHAVGAPWCRLDAAIFAFDIDPGMVGKTMHLKGYSFNLFGQQLQTIATDFSFPIAEPPGQFIGQQLRLVNFNGMTISGNNVTKTAQTFAWDSSVHSSQSYINGAFVSFSPNDLTSASMFGLNTDPTTDGSYASIDYAMYVTGAGSLQVYNNGTAVFTGGPAYAVGDTLVVSYDGAFVRYTQNNVVFYQQPAPSNLQLFLDSSVFSSGATITNVQFGPYGTATPVLYIARGNCIVTDEAIVKQGGSGAWDSDVYSINGFPTCHLVWKASDTTHSFEMALSQVIPNAPSNTALDFSLECVSVGTLIIHEGATTVGTFGTYVVGDLLAITYDGATVTYSKNGAVLRTVAIAGKTFYMTSAFFTPGASVNSLEFGPGATIPIVDTSGINPNAATISLIANNASGSGGTLTGGTGISSSGFVLHPSGPAFDCAAVVTATIGVAQTAGTLGDVKVLVRFADDGTTLLSATQEVPINSTNLQPYTLQWEFAHSKANAGTGLVNISFDVGSALDAYNWNTASLQIEYLIR